ncbi:glycosyltransferase family 4 protein [Planktomarina temperata]|nr:glycosyltransferase family 4 protein [Planktomarina temperata]
MLDKKIALLTYSTTSGGAAIAAERFYNNLSQQLKTITVYDQTALRGPLTRSEKFVIKIGRTLSQLFGIDLYSFDFGKRYLTDEIINAINQHDIIVIHWAHFATLGIKDIELFNKPTIFVAHDMFLLNGITHYIAPTSGKKINPKLILEHIVIFLLKKRIKYHRKKITDLIDCINCPSTWLSNEFADIYPALKHKVIPNYYPKLPDPLEQEQYTIFQNELPIICFAAYGIKDNNRKGYYKFRRIISEVLENFPNINILIVGDDNVNVPRGTNVKLLGKLTPFELMSLLKISDIYIHTASIDNSPNIITEAKIMGAHVFAFNVGGISEQITNEEEGTLIGTNQTEEFTTKLITHIAHSIAFPKQRNRKPIWPKEKLDTENAHITTKWMQLFDEIGDV